MIKRKALSPGAGGPVFTKNADIRKANEDRFVVADDGPDQDILMLVLW